MITYYQKGGEMRGMLRTLKVAIVVGCLLVPSGLLASGLTPILNQAEAQYKKGDVISAASALRQALVVVYNHSKLKINKAVLVGKKPAGFGMIQRRANNIFKPNETIIIYVEPVGYHFAKKGDLYSFGVTADFIVTDVKGNVLGGKKGFGSWEITTRERPLFDFFMTLTYNFSGIRPGKYFLITTLHDKHGTSTATIKMPFVIAK